MAQGTCSTIIFGCGNTVMGDDGFGPAVIAHLSSNYDLPQGVMAVDAGTGVREYLFDYLLMAEGRPGRVVLLDAVDFEGRRPGELFWLAPGDIPARKIHDFSLHQFPTVNLLTELQQYTGMKIDMLVAQVEFIPEFMQEGLSPSMKEAVVSACEKVVEMVSPPTETRL